MGAHEERNVIELRACHFSRQPKDAVWLIKLIEAPNRLVAL